MSKIVVVLLLCFSLLGSSSINWDYTHTFKLFKDEVATISVIKKDYKTQSGLDGKLSFYWTLYQNDLLVLLVNYEGFKTQYVLKLLYKRDVVRINLLGDYKNVGKRIFLILKFSDFEKEKKEASIDALIYDPKKRIEVIFTDPKR